MQSACSNEKTNDIDTLIKIHKTILANNYNNYKEIVSKVSNLENRGTICIENRLKSKKLQYIKFNLDGTSWYFSEKYINNDSLDVKLIKSLEIKSIYLFAEKQVVEISLINKFSDLYNLKIVFCKKKNLLDEIYGLSSPIEKELFKNWYLIAK